MSLPSIADDNLGLTAAEILMFRQQRQIAQHQQNAAQGHAAPPAGRGRGQSRSSNPSSRAASAASSQGNQGRVFLDPGSLQSLYVHFEHLMTRIQARISDLEQATQCSVQASYDRAGNMIQNADAEIARMKRILTEIDHLEGELDKVKRIREVIKSLRIRVDQLDWKMDQRSSHNHGQGASGGPRRR